MRARKWDAGRTLPLCLSAGDLSTQFIPGPSFVRCIYNATPISVLKGGMYRTSTSFASIDDQLFPLPSRLSLLLFLEVPWSVSGISRSRIVTALFLNVLGG